MASTSYTRTLFTARADFAAVANTVAEASLFGGTNDQPIISALQFEGPAAYGRWYRLKAGGVLSTTGTPTILFGVRANTTFGSSVLSGPLLGVTASITTASGITNKWWDLELEIYCGTPGIGTGNCTLICNGKVTSPGGFGSPFIYAMEPTTPDTATWTQTIDGSLTQCLNLSVTWGTASASNTITCKTASLVEMN